MKHLTQEQIEQFTKEDLKNYTKQIQEEIDKWILYKGNEIIHDRDSKEAFRELVSLKIKCDLQINLLEFREMVHRGKNRKKNNEEQ